MSTANWNKLKVEVLQDVADWFAVEVESADPEKVTKKEILAALAAGENPVSWEDYETIYLPAKAEVAAKSAPVVELTGLAQPVVVVEPVDEEPKVLVIMERENGRYDIRGYTFTKDHPFNHVREKDAEFIIKHDYGFRLALPSELADYYN